VGLKELKQEILRDSKRRIAEIRKEAEKEIKRIRKEAEAEVSSYKRKRDNELKAAAADLKRKYREMAELEGSKIIQEAKHKAITMLFDDIRHLFTRLKKQEREKIFSALLKRAESEIDISRVFVSEKDIGTAKNHGYKAEKADIIAGLIAENSDGTVMVNYSIDMLIDQFMQKNTAKAAKILFNTK